MENCFRIGTRTSPLALIQIEEMVRCLRSTIPGFCFEVVGMETWGDRDSKTPISMMEGTDFFTREIDDRSRQDHNKNTSLLLGASCLYYNKRKKN